MENERRVKRLAEAGVMDVPHGVLSKEVGTPEVVPRYGDVVEVEVGVGVGVEAWRLEGEGPVESVEGMRGDRANREVVEGPWLGDNPKDREGDLRSEVGEGGAAVR